MSKNTKIILIAFALLFHRVIFEFIMMAIYFVLACIHGNPMSYGVEKADDAISQAVYQEFGKEGGEDIIINLSSWYESNSGTAPKEGEVQLAHSLEMLSHDLSCSEYLFDIKLRVFLYGGHTLSEEMERLQAYGYDFAEADGWLCALLSGAQIVDFPISGHCGYRFEWNEGHPVQIPEDNEIVNDVYRKFSPPETINLGGGHNEMTIGFPANGEVKFANKMQELMESPEHDYDWFDVRIEIYVSGDWTIEEEIERLRNYDILLYKETNGKLYTGLSGKQLKEFPADVRCGYEIYWNELNDVSGKVVMSYYDSNEENEISLYPTIPAAQRQNKEAEGYDRLTIF